MKGKTPFWVERQIELGAAGLCIAMTVALALLGVEPLLDNYTAQQEQAQQLTAHKAKDLKLLASRREYRKRHEQVLAELDASPLQLQSEGEINVRVAGLNRLAEQIGATVEEVRLDAPMLYPRYRTMPINLIGRADAVQFMNLLGLINQSFPDTAVTKFEILGDGGRSDQTLRFELQLIWYASSSPSSNRSLARTRAPEDEE